MIMGSTGCRAMRTSGIHGAVRDAGTFERMLGTHGARPAAAGGRVPWAANDPPALLERDRSPRSGCRSEAEAAGKAWPPVRRAAPAPGGCRPRSDAHRASSALVPYARCVRPSADTRAIQRAAPSSGGGVPAAGRPARFRRRPLRLVRLGQRLQPRHVRRQRPRQAAAPTAAGQPRRHRPQVLLQRLRAVLAHPRPSRSSRSPIDASRHSASRAAIPARTGFRSTYAIAASTAASLSSAPE